MAVEIDQSGKIEQLDTCTIVACANGVTEAIYIKTVEKRLLFITLRTSVVLKNDRPAVAFSILVFLLLRKLKILPSTIIIDEEYTGKNALIERTIKNLFDRQFKKKWIGVIRIQQVGKLSPAHRIAWNLHKHPEKRKKIQHIQARDIIRLWQ